MKIITLLLLTACTAFAQGTFYGPVPSTGWCSVTGATNATPIVITVASNNCGLANGQFILITLVEGNTAANVNAASNQLARKVSGLSGTHFNLVDAAGTNVAGNGTYTANTGMVRQAQSYTTKADPIVFLDGSGGTLTTAMSNTASNGRANTNNFIYNALVSATTSWNTGGTTTQWGADEFYMANTANTASYYQAVGDATSLTSAQFGINNLDQMVGTPGCNESSNYCDGRVDEQDFTSENLPYMMQAYSTVRSTLTSPQKSRILSLLLNDNLPAQGGIGTTACTKQTVTSGVGTMTITNGSTAVVGTGTHWNSTQQLVAGMILYQQGNGRPYVQVVSVTDDTHITITTGSFANNGGSGTYAYSIVPAWTSTNCGIVWFLKHHDASPLNGGSVSTTDYPPDGGLAPQNYAWNNLIITKLLGYTAVGIATCEDDARGCLLLEQAWEYWYDLVRPYVISTYTGFNTGGGVYTNERLAWLSATIALMMRNSVTSPLDVTGDSYIAATPSMFLRRAIPNIGPGGGSNYDSALSMGDGAAGQTIDDSGITMFTSLYLNGNTGDAPYLNYFLRNQWPFRGSPGYGGGIYLPYEYVFLDPAQTSTNPSGAAPLQYAFNANQYSACVAVFPNCVQNAAFNYALSQTDWTATRTMLLVSGTSNNQDIDHQGEEVGPGLQVYRNTFLLGGDSAGGYGSAPNNGLGAEYNSGVIELGGANSYWPGGGSYNNTAMSFVTMPRVGGGAPTGDSQGRYGYWMVDCSLAYVSAANVSRCQTQVTHFKKSGSQDYIVKWTDVALTGAITGASGAAIREYQHAYLNGVGTPSASTAISASRAAGTLSNTQSTAKMNLAVLASAGANSIFINTQNSSDTNGSYTGQAGYTWRWGICASTTGTSCNTAATAGDWMTIIEPINGISGSMPALTLITPGTGAARVVQIADATTPKVAAFATGGNTINALAFTSTHSGTGQYLIAGLTPNVYNITAPSASPTSCTVVAGDNTCYFESTSGSISLAVNTCTISSTSLGPWTNTQVFSGTTIQFTANNCGAGTLTWTVTGSLPTGLSGCGSTTGTTCSLTGTLSGTGTFTPQINVTDGGSNSANLPTSIVVNAVPTCCSPTSPLTAGTQNVAYSQALTGGAGTAPLTYAITSGSVCSGSITLSSSGVLSGTCASTGTFAFTVKTTDANSILSSGMSYSLTINAGAVSTGTVFTGIASGGAVIR
jgi:hypothetical protein